jgi:hypothetical protein
MDNKDEKKNNESASNQAVPLREGEDYYLENGFFVFTAKHHLKRGHCCQSGCRHCPYGFKEVIV